MEGWGEVSDYAVKEGEEGLECSSSCIRSGFSKVFNIWLGLVPPFSFPLNLTMGRCKICLRQVGPTILGILVRYGRTHIY